MTSYMRSFVMVALGAALCAGCNSKSSATDMGTDGHTGALTCKPDGQTATLAALYGVQANLNVNVKVTPGCTGTSCIVNTDATLMKNFTIKEKKSIQVRVEAYSATNTPQWGNPNTSFGGTTFGQITSAGGNRTLLVAMKFYY